MKKILTITAIALMASLALTGCGSKSYKDGTYTGQSEVYEDEENGGGGDGYGVAKITVEGGVITGCEFDTYEPDGTKKDEDYGKQNGEIANRDYYNKAQKALAGNEVYAKKLAETGSLKEVDAVSGATISYNEFIDAVEAALQQAEE